MSDMREYLLGLDPEQVEREMDYIEVYVVDGYKKCRDLALQHLEINPSVLIG